MHDFILIFSPLKNRCFGVFWSLRKRSKLNRNIEGLSRGKNENRARFLKISKVGSTLSKKFVQIWDFCCFLGPKKNEKQKKTCFSPKMVIF